MSELIIDMGIEEIAPFIDRLEEDNALSVVEHVSYFRSSRLNTSHITLAVERASKVVCALKTYSHQDSTNHLTQTDMNKDLLTVLTL